MTWNLQIIGYERYKNKPDQRTGSYPDFEKGLKSRISEVMPNLWLKHIPAVNSLAAMSTLFPFQQNLVLP